ncbi:MAG: hypothetical protein J6Y90_02305, partial [Lachnospiraceae bacterium]|nr:hypothetical protein [Lachnospiraceae bacterium]
MKQFKVLLNIAIILACVILIAVTASKADSEEQYTQEKAVEYARSLEGQAIDVDGTGYDCVDIAKLYFKVV